MKLLHRMIALMFAVGISGPSHAYAVVQADACPDNGAATCANSSPDISPLAVPWSVPGAAMPVAFNGHGAGPDFGSDSGPDVAPSSVPLSDAGPGTFGASAVVANADSPVPAPTAATLALVGLALVVLGLSRRKRSVHIQIS